MQTLDKHTSDGMVHLHDGSYHRPLNVVTREYDLNRCFANSIIYMQINKTLRNINKSRIGEERSYQQYYTNDIRKKVEKFCHKSLNLLHYDF